MSPCIHGKKIVDQNTKQTEGSFTSVQMVHTHTPSSHTTHFHTTQSYLHKQIHSHTIRPQHTTCPQLPQTGSDIACYTKLDHTPVPLNDIDRQTSHLATKIVPSGRTFANVAFLSDSRRCYSQEHRSKRETQTINGRRTIFLRICLRV